MSFAFWKWVWLVTALAILWTVAFWWSVIPCVHLQSEMDWLRRALGTVYFGYATTRALQMAIYYDRLDMRSRRR